MKIELYNTKCRLIGDGLQAVRARTKYQPLGYQHSTQFQNGYWDGYVYIVRADGYFSLGNLETVYNTILELGMPISEVSDYRRVAWKSLSKIIERDVELTDVGLYDHQKQALDSCVKSIGNILQPCGVFDLATNAGKTLVITKLLSISGLKAIVALHNEVLLKDVVKSLSAAGLSVGTVTSSTYSVSENHDVIVVMYKSALNRVKDREFKFWLDVAECVIVDECHRAGAKNYLEFLNSLKAPIRWGFSGSAFDNKNANEIRGYFGDTLITRDNNQLIAAGVSAKVKVIMPKIPYPRCVDYEEAFNYMKISPTRNNMFLSHLVKGEGFIWCVEHHDHADAVAKMLVGRGFDIVQYDGRTRKDHSYYIKQFNSGGIDGMVINASGMEGLNLDNLKTIIYARGGKSLVWLKQFLGRGLRKKSDGTTHVNVIDCWDDSRFLKDASRVRHNYYQSQNFEIIE